MIVIRKCAPLLHAKNLQEWASTDGENSGRMTENPPTIDQLRQASAEHWSASQETWESVSGNPETAPGSYQQSKGIEVTTARDLWRISEDRQGFHDITPAQSQLNPAEWNGMKQSMQ